VDTRHEDARLRALRAYQVLDTEPETAYDTLVRLAASVCGAPIALISLADASREWFKASYGLGGMTETPRASGFCDHAIRGTGVFEVADAREDERFAAHPLVTGAPLVRFYAGVPLVTPEGDALGAICVLDREPRSLTPAQREQLELLARLAVEELERRKRLLRLAGGLAQAGGFTGEAQAPPRAANAVRALLDAVGAATGGTAALLRRAEDGTYAVVRTLDQRPLPGGRAALSRSPLRLEHATADELAVAIPGAGDQPELVLAARFRSHRPGEADRAALELVAAAFAVAVRNVTLHAEAERRRMELHDARATQAELVARLARDVRGPVTSIVGFARLLEEDGRFPPDAREALAVVRASGERVGEIASDVDLLSRMELAAVEPQWRTVDPAALVASAGAVIEQRSTVRIVADPDLLGTVLGRLVEDGRRPSAPVHARIEDLGEAVAIELSGTGASPTGDGSGLPTIGGRLAARIAERHGGTYRAGGTGGSWWLRLTLPSDPRRADRRLRVLLVGPSEPGEDLAEQLRALDFGVETAVSASDVREAALAATDVVVFAAGRGSWAQREGLPSGVRRRLGLVALSSGEQRAGDGWDATVRAPARPGDLGAAVHAAAAKARRRAGDDAAVPSPN
jgi:signal transduction histidine kinase